MPSQIVSLVVNGEHREFIAAPGATLLACLRESLGLTAAKRGCAQGACGSCTVLVDGRPEASCLVAVETVAGGSVRTLEGVATGGDLDEVQSAFVDCFATQCGFCTSGMIMVAEALLDRNPDPSEEDVIEAISGNVCRCTGYRPIVQAVLEAAARRREEAVTR
ncbi:(2Fe-2S)-binding protein [Nonomuraea fuscirosea]|uniref:Carbon-monoxide dehydrogenase small subunit n=1 Tax=Nonomuraea fuscirosea TaxID=1291556 RepID=A0A2T0N1X9_9ACTN|nr:(2Fe-2S)-binding protein [Nonomuraea fuscirosea]PRX65951.1 carbon-monoxide dehydrogenase small subunit [Nonomuraea fuscirosea]WSA56551.1 (2Fe-2S)-binding protein [Nonomuraea fuscirosea]